MEHEALFYKQLNAKNVQCELCPQNCVILPDNYGKCRARKNIKGKLYSMVYAKPVSVATDPIEKKPLFHFLPGTKTFSLGTTGCNLHCEFCFTPDTIIPTEKGILTLKEIFEKGSNEKPYLNGKVRRINNPVTTTHKGNAKEVMYAFEHQYEGELVSIKPYYSPEIKCTPNHKFFTTKCPSSENLSKTRADSITKEDYLAIPKTRTFSNLKEIKTKNVLEHYTKIKIKKGNKKVSKSLIEDIIRMKQRGATSKEIGYKFELHPVYIRRIFAKIRKYGKKSLFFKENRLIEKNGYIKFLKGQGKGIPSKISVNDNLAKLLGYFVSEGHVTPCKNRPNSYCAIFSFGKHEENQIKETESLLKRIFKVNPSVRIRKTTVTVECHQAPVALFFKSLCGHGAKNKKVPWVINKSSKEIIQTFLQAYVEGNGWTKEDTIISTNTVSKELALGIYSLFLKLGFLPSFYTWKPIKKKKIENRIVNQSTLYYVKIQAEKFRRKFLNKKCKPNKQSMKSVKFIENRDYYFLPIYKISKEKYKGPVYNIEVKDDHSYLANFIAVSNCQNWQISQSYPEDTPSVSVAPEEVVENALNEGCPSISYTYNEPTIFFEYVLDIAKKAKYQGLKNITVSNGFINPEPAKMLYKYIDATNVDLKSFTEEYYKRFCFARLQPVLETLKLLKEMGVWIELTTLIIPGLNDDMKMIKGMCEWVNKELGPCYPLHLSRFHPCYNMKDKPPTPFETLKKAYQTAKKAGLHYVYVGNVPEEGYNHTFCPRCEEALIKRNSFFNVTYNKIRANKCYKCGLKIEGVWK
ncbi:AmmeMemoRadiSam system radical SAM enzyme [Candidatus Woesearchaeota archaeon]|nr:AmmeMemoRadiSam system radical SAM enzyme [Candidatus Woesearchaeota archaeon]